MTIERLVVHNPWWADKSAIRKDKHIGELYNARLRWRPSLLDEIYLAEDLVYIIRGPRQIGKTTTLKLLIESLLDKGADSRQICYLDCELAGIRNFKELIDMIGNYVEFVRSTLRVRRLFLLIDEVTFIRDWAIGIKALSDKGTLENTTTILTGSNAVDLKKGGERMPGRRGERAGLDKRLLPLTFREYVFAFFPELKEKIPSLSLSPDLRDFREKIFEMSLIDKKLLSLFSQYLLTGGFPRPVNSFLKAGKVEDFVFELHRDSIVGEVTRIGKKETYLREIVSWVSERHGNPFDWRDISRETDIGKHDTARDYAEDLELLFLWDIFFKSQRIDRPSPAFRSQKKIYFKDPFIFLALWSWSRGTLEPWRTTMDYMMNPSAKAALVESIVAAHLKNKFGREVFYWKPDHEVDFIVFREGRLRQFIEVKYQETLRAENFRHLKKRGRGILLSKSGYEMPTENILVMPVHAFLAAL